MMDTENSSILLFTVGRLDGILARCPQLNDFVGSALSPHYSEYLKSLGDEPTRATIFNANVGFAYTIHGAVQQGFQVYSAHQAIQPYMSSINRLTVSLYGQPTKLYAALDILPDSVKLYHYSHIFYEEYLH